MKLLDFDEFSHGDGPKAETVLEGGQRGHLLRAQEFLGSKIYNKIT